MKHVNHSELFESLPARITYLQDFLDFGPDDIKALLSGQKHVKAVLPSIVDLVYSKLLQYDITARVFANRDSRCMKDPETWPSTGGGEIQRRKIFLRWYLTKLNSDPTTMKYWEYLDKVGSMHVGASRHAPVHVEYIFLGSCLGFIHNALLEAIFSLTELKISERLAITKAFGKIIWIQNDLLARWQIPRTESHDGSEPREQGPTCAKDLADDLDSELVLEESQSLCPRSISQENIDIDHCPLHKPAWPLRNMDMNLSSRIIKDFALLRLSSPDDQAIIPLSGHEACRKLKVMNVEQLHDGSLELLVRSSEIGTVQAAAAKEYPQAVLQMLYNPWTPTTEAEAYFGPSIARDLYHEWVTARARRLGQAPSIVGDYYKALSENAPKP